MYTDGQSWTFITNYSGLFLALNAAGWKWTFSSIYPGAYVLRTNVKERAEKIAGEWLMEIKDIAEVILE